MNMLVKQDLPYFEKEHKAVVKVNYVTIYVSHNYRFQMVI